MLAALLFIFWPFCWFCLTTLTNHGDYREIHNQEKKIGRWWVSFVLLKKIIKTTSEDSYQHIYVLFLYWFWVCEDWWWWTKKSARPARFLINLPCRWAQLEIPNTTDCLCFQWITFGANTWNQILLLEF